MNASRTLLPVLALIVSPALAGENNDLDFIPPAVNEENAAPAAARDHTLSATEALAFTSKRADGIVPIPGRSSANWENRVSIDGRMASMMAAGVKLTLSDRLSFTGDDRRDFPERRNFRNDLREAYITGEPWAQTYVEAGRINLKYGVATGYNPTDFLRSGSQVEQSSSDPAALRENRLGTVMIRGQKLWPGGSASFAYAPRLADRPRLDEDATTLDPRFDRTNGRNRWLGTMDLEVAHVSTQWLVHDDGENMRFGANASATLSNSIVGYVEWAGGRSADLADASFHYARETGTYPEGTPQLIGGKGYNRFRNDFAGGVSWASPTKVTVNAEYHFHQAGLSQNQWKRSFEVGANGGLGAAEMWQTRSYAAATQQPASRHRVFLRVAWDDAFVAKLNLAGFILADLGDGSATAQIEATYPLSPLWSASALATANLGRRRSEFGSLAERGKGVIQLVRYF